MNHEFRYDFSSSSIAISIPWGKKKKKGKEKDEEEESFSLVASYSCYNFHSKKSAVIPFCFFDVSSCDI